MFTRSQTVLDTRTELSWTQLQWEYPDSMTSLARWSLDELATLFTENDGPAQGNWSWTLEELIGFYAAVENFLRRPLNE